jgi:hypothetical protein
MAAHPSNSKAPCWRVQRQAVCASTRDLPEANVPEVLDIHLVMDLAGRAA